MPKNNDNIVPSKILSLSHEDILEEVLDTS